MNMTYFKFEDIFSGCMTDYEKHANIRENIQDSKLQNFCSHVKNEWGVSKYGGEFISDCKKHILYLDYIKDKKSPEKETSCKYFNYLLKDILKYYGCSVNNCNEAYQKIIDHTKGNEFMNVSDACKNQVKDLHDDLYSILKNLKELYTYFILKGNICTSNSACFNKYKELSKMPMYSQNDSFRELLINFMEKNIKNMMQIIEKKELRTVPYHTISTNTPSIILSLIIITITVFMIMFFVYKYIQYGSLLQATTRIRRMWSKKKKGKMYIMDSSEITQNKLFHNKYQRECTSIGYI
ncbi:variable surface protein [Plasmodium gonderi]|uniref:Variable surface protein n=1 Tax=Plasmodium gonderi TaxID=77519 RepID=A0A1Y1JUU4_PLAGO|nr:variable surface protein [Plasmodium gonderi]GAW84183.1 variable surface protein [Plasmodium gonderi]